MELSKEVQNAKRQVESAIECLIELRSALEGILVYDKGPQVDEESMMIQMIDYHMTRKEAAAFLGKAPVLCFNEADAIFGIRKSGAEDAVD